MLTIVLALEDEKPNCNSVIQDLLATFSAPWCLCWSVLRESNALPTEIHKIPTGHVGPVTKNTFSGCFRFAADMLRSAAWSRICWRLLQHFKRKFLKKVAKPQNGPVQLTLSWGEAICIQRNPWIFYLFNRCPCPGQVESTPQKVPLWGRVVDGNGTKCGCMSDHLHWFKHEWTLIQQTACGVWTSTKRFTGTHKQRSARRNSESVSPQNRHRCTHSPFRRQQRTLGGITKSRGGHKRPSPRPEALN